MPKLEPTYLRYVYDSLNKGSLNAENAAALPQGFIGLYEQEFTQKTPAGERKKVLNQLALWAIFKGPISANMAAAVLELEEDQMKDLVDTFSSWFNSPESGKYQLYHERLKLYLLQKLKAEEIQVLNEKLIFFLEVAIKQANGEENEYYALAHLHQHMALESQLGNHYDRLHGYVNQESLWRRQIQLSKGYEWSQNAVQQGIKEGARRNHEMNTIRSTVNSVKLMTQEQNSAEDILNLLNEGDYLTALKRVESWEGERQFKLYLLFIHELTIGTSKEADFRKESCKAVLEAIDQTTEDHSVLDWCTFYPEIAIYKYHEELLKMELDALIIWRRGSYTLSEMNNFNFSEFQILASEIKYDKDKSNAYREISKILLEHGDKEKSIQLASEIPNGLEKCLNYLDLYKILIKKGDTEGAKFASRESFVSISELHLDGYEEALKSKLYANLSKELIEYGDKDGAKFALEESLNVMKEVSDWDFTEDYAVLLKVVMEQGGKKESLRIISEIPDNSFYKSKVYAEFSKILLDHGDNEGSKSCLKESLRMIPKISDEYTKNWAYQHLSKLLMEQGDEEESLRMISKITDEYNKFEGYVCLSKVLIDQGDKEGSFRMISEMSGWDKSEIYEYLSKALMEQRDKKESFRVASKLSDNKKKFKIYAELSKILLDQGDKDGAKSALKESFISASDINDNYSKSGAYREISKLFMEQGDKEESLRIAADIKSGSERLKAFTEFGKKLAFREAQCMFSSIPSEENKIAVVKGMSENINDQMELSDAFNPYLHNYSEHTQYLPNILFYQAKMACFFQKERNEEKLDMLSEVLDIKDWRRISASA